MKKKLLVLGIAVSSFALYAAEHNNPPQNKNIAQLHQKLKSSIHKGDASKVREIIAAKADVNYRITNLDIDSMACTPLFDALNKGQNPDTTLAITKTLIDAQADVNMRDNENQTPFLRAIWMAQIYNSYPYQGIFELLFKAGADIAATTPSEKNLLTLTDTTHYVHREYAQGTENIRNCCLKYRELSYNNMKEKQSHIIHTIVPIMPRVLTRIIADYVIEYPFEKELGRPDKTEEV